MVIYYYVVKVKHYLKQIQINGQSTNQPPPWQGIIGTMRCCLLDIYKRKQNMVPTVIEQDDFDNFF